LSNDSGSIWYGYYNNEFVPVDITKNKEIYHKGITPTVLNTLHESNPDIWNNFITYNNVLRF